MAQSLTLSLSSASKRYGVGRSALLDLVAAHKIPAFKLGPRTLILRPIADAYFADCPKRPEPVQLSLIAALDAALM